MSREQGRAVEVLALAVAGVGPAAVGRAVRDLRETGVEVTADLVIDRLRRGTQRPGHARVAAARARLDELGAEVLVAGEPAYPRQLSLAWPELGAPLWLFARSPGRGLPEGPAVAVVGTRHPSLDGLETARALGACLARAGVTVVSGLARGIDQAAHAGALEAGGRTVGVLGTGFGVDYPKGDGRLRGDVAEAGGLVTELLPDTPPRGHQFLARNRIVAGLAEATVVVEGRVRSGALATAQHAAEQGREVLACPGSINAPRSRAPLALIRDGATVLTRLEDAVEASGVACLRAEAAPAQGPDGVGLPPAAARVLGRLGPAPATVDGLVRGSGLPASQVVPALGELCAAGRARRVPEGFVAG